MCHSTFLDLRHSKILHTFLFVCLFILSLKNRYREIYQPYKHLLSTDADKKVDKFLSRDRSLREYTKEIEILKKMADDIGSFPVLVPMYFFLVDCTHFNQVQ